MMFSSDEMTFCLRRRRLRLHPFVYVQFVYVQLVDMNTSE